MTSADKDSLDPVSVQVALRIRPLVQSEIANGSQICLETEAIEPQVKIRGSDRTFTFNYVFGPQATQEEFYNKAVKNLVGKVFKGNNVTILAYGQSGSGKTFSMGTCYNEDGSLEDMGVIPRAITDIFDGMRERQDWQFKVSVSFMELYQEQLFDLLATNRCVVDLREDGKVIKIPGLTEVPVTDFNETIKALIQGSTCRVKRVAAMNAQSSPSHAIFTITIHQQQQDNVNTATSSKLHFVVLAGSESSKKTNAIGEMFKEGVTINKGLLVLGKVISALGDETQKRFISYRDSKLTRLLQDSLGGNSVTLMIACVSPADYNLDETLSTLRYADRARHIKNKPVVNQDPEAAEIMKLRQENRQLRLQLFAKNDRVITSSESGDHHEAALNRQLQEFNKPLALKEELATQLTADSDQIMKIRIDYEQKVKELEQKVTAQQKELDELTQMLKNTNASTKKVTEELEHTKASLDKKIAEQTELVKMKEKADEQINQNMESTKVQLIRQMRQENERFCVCKLQKDKELMKLRDQDRRRQNQVEEAVAINKRLKLIHHQTRLCGKK